MSRPEPVFPTSDFPDGDFLFPSDVPNRCENGEAFLQWTDALCDDVEADPAEWAVNRATLLLVHRYFDWYATVPKRCRHQVSDLGHECIWHAFEHGYRRLRRIGLTLTPPPFNKPPSKPRPPEVRAIVLAESEE